MTLAQPDPHAQQATARIDVASLCQYDEAGDYGSHRAYHLGEPCPFGVVAAVLAGEPDIRDMAVSWSIEVHMTTGKGAGLIPPLTLNGSRGMNPMAHAAKVKMIRNRTRNALRELDPPIPLLHHIRVELHLQPQTNAVRDRDNLVATLKPCIDAMTPDKLERWDGIVPGDDPRYVSWVPPVIHRARRGEGARMWLTITTYPDEAARDGD